MWTNSARTFSPDRHTDQPGHVFGSRVLFSARLEACVLHGYCAGHPALPHSRTTLSLKLSEAFGLRTSTAAIGHLEEFLCLWKQAYPRYYVPYGNLGSVGLVAGFGQVHRRVLIPESVLYCPHQTRVVLRPASVIVGGMR